MNQVARFGIFSRLRLGLALVVLAVIGLWGWQWFQKWQDDVAVAETRRLDAEAKRQAELAAPQRARDEAARNRQEIAIGAVAITKAISCENQKYAHVYEGALFRSALLFARLGQYDDYDRLAPRIPKYLSQWQANSLQYVPVWLEFARVQRSLGDQAECEQTLQGALALANQEFKPDRPTDKVETWQYRQHDESRIAAYLAIVEEQSRMGDVDGARKTVGLMKALDARGRMEGRALQSIVGAMALCGDDQEALAVIGDLSEDEFNGCCYEISGKLAAAKEWKRAEDFAYRAKDPEFAIARMRADQGDFGTAPWFADQVRYGNSRAWVKMHIAECMISAGQGDLAVRMMDEEVDEKVRIKLLAAILPEPLKTRSAAAILRILPRDNPDSLNVIARLARLQLAKNDSKGYARTIAKAKQIWKSHFSLLPIKEQLKDPRKWRDGSESQYWNCAMLDLAAEQAIGGDREGAILSLNGVLDRLNSKEMHTPLRIVRVLTCLGRLEEAKKYGSARGGYDFTSEIIKTLADLGEFRQAWEILRGSQDLCRKRENVRVLLAAQLAAGQLEQALQEIEKRPAIYYSLTDSYLCLAEAIADDLQKRSAIPPVSIQDRQAAKAEKQRLAAEARRQEAEARHRAEKMRSGLVEAKRLADLAARQKARQEDAGIRQTTAIGVMAVRKALAADSNAGDRLAKCALAFAKLDESAEFERVAAQMPEYLNLKTTLQYLPNWMNFAQAQALMGDRAGWQKTLQTFLALANQEFKPSKYTQDYEYRQYAEFQMSAFLTIMEEQVRLGDFDGARETLDRIKPVAVRWKGDFSSRVVVYAMVLCGVGQEALAANDGEPLKGVFGYDFVRLRKLQAAKEWQKAEEFVGLFSNGEIRFQCSVSSLRAEQGDFDGAQKLAEQIKDAKLQAEAKTHLAKCLMSAGLGDRAVRLVDNEPPGSPAKWSIMNIVLPELLKSRSVVDILAVLPDDHLDSLRIVTAMARVLLEKKDKEGYQLVIAKSRSIWTAHFLLPPIKEQLEDPKKWRDGSESQHWNRGMLDLAAAQANGGDREGATISLDSVLARLNPMEMHTPERIAYVLVFLGQDDKAHEQAKARHAYGVIPSIVMAQAQCGDFKKAWETVRGTNEEFRIENSRYLLAAQVAAGQAEQALKEIEDTFANPYNTCTAYLYLAEQISGYLAKRTSVQAPAAK